MVIERRPGGAGDPKLVGAVRPHLQTVRQEGDGRNGVVGGGGGEVLRCIYGDGGMGGGGVGNRFCTEAGRYKVT